MAKKPTAKQIAARKKFAAMAKSGAFKKKRSTKKRAVKKAIKKRVVKKVAKKKATRKSYTGNTVAKYAKSHGFVLPHGYEVKVVKKRAPKKRKKK